MSGAERARERRLRCYLVTESILAHLFSESKTTQVVQGIPADGRVLGIYSDYLRQAVSIVVEHASFDAVPEGEELPRHLITLKDIQ